MNEWLDRYIQIINSYGLSQKTLSNRYSSIKWVRLSLGTKDLDRILPYEIAAVLRSEHDIFPSKAKRLLGEIRNIFYEAILNGIVHTNPATPIKPLKAPIRRQRLSIEDWLSIYEVALQRKQPWISVMLLLALVTGQRRSDISKLSNLDVHEDLLYITQDKTGSKIAIPIDIELKELGIMLRGVIHMSKAVGAQTFIRKANGTRLSNAYLSSTFHSLVLEAGINKNVTLHECRSLSERLYRKQGIDTRLLLGHKHQSMTDMYNDDRGLTKDSFTVISI